MEIRFRHIPLKKNMTVARQPELRTELRAARERYDAAAAANAALHDRRADIIVRDAQDIKRGRRRKSRHRIVRRIAACVIVVVLILTGVVVMMPSYGKTVYSLSQIKSVTLGAAIDSSFDAPGNFENAEGDKVRADAHRKVNQLENVFTLAESKLGCKYVHATAGPDTFDCQGYVHYIFTHCDANVLCYVPRGGCTNQYNAIKQYQVSTNPKDAKRGDIVYFYGGGRWKHVGIALGNGKLIHATTIGPGRSCVKITDMPDWYQKYAVVRVLG